MGPLPAAAPGSPGWSWSPGLALSAGKKTQREPGAIRSGALCSTLCSMDRHPQRLEVQGVEKGNKEKK